MANLSALVQAICGGGALLKKGLSVPKAHAQLALMPRPVPSDLIDGRVPRFQMWLASIRWDRRRSNLACDELEITNASCSSARANAAPMQWWIPEPKVICWAARPEEISKSSGRSHAVGVSVSTC